LPNDWASTLLLRASLSSFCRSSGSPAPAAAWVSSLACFSSSRALLAAFEDSCRHSASLGVLSEGSVLLSSKFCRGNEQAGPDNLKETQIALRGRDSSSAVDATS
ncbi:hypothetical protein KCU60_g44, partial [Aureobasidium melanogenum]